MYIQHSPQLLPRYATYDAAAASARLPRPLYCSHGACMRTPEYPKVPDGPAAICGDHARWTAGSAFTTVSFICPEDQSVLRIRLVVQNFQSPIFQSHAEIAVEVYDREYRASFGKRGRSKNLAFAKAPISEFPNALDVLKQFTDSLEWSLQPWTF